jgi:hypothetical protein
MLEPWDLAIVSQSSGRLRALKPTHSTAVFLATLKFVGGE